MDGDEKVGNNGDMMKFHEEEYKNGKEKEEKLSFSEQWARYPKHIFFIVGNEFCERFSYYGMRSVLLLYLRNYLHFGDDTATSIYHAFTVVAYFTPLFGAIIADSYWGKYKTIIILSIVYVFGHVVKTIGSIPYIPSHTAHVALSMIGLFFIACGTGGIKPCVSSFGGDQFKPDQTLVRKNFFSLFYLAINAGSLISTFVTPIFRADVNCYPNESGPEFDECYALAFGVPGALMLVALLLFIAGSKWYTKRPPEGSIFWKFCTCIGSAIKQKWNTPKSLRTKEHWLEYAHSSPMMIRDTKYVLRVLVLFTPMPFFWALFDQQGSRWTLQAIQLDGHMGSLHLKPDQVETLNPILIVILIPLFETTLYPALRYFKIPFPPLRRMTVGLILAGISFIFAAILQLEINKTLSPVPGWNQYSVRIINTAECNIDVKWDELDNPVVFMNNVSDTREIFINTNSPFKFDYIDCNNIYQQVVHDSVAQENIYDVIIMDDNWNVQNMITHKTEDGGGSFTYVNAGKRTLWFHSPQQRRVEEVHPGERSDPISVDIGTFEYEYYITNDSNASPVGGGSIEIEVGAVYSIIQDEDGNTSFSTLDMAKNSLNVGWIFPQFIIITVGEIFLSITGLEFSYSQAPPNMKSVLTSFWLLTVSFGNIIVLIIAESRAIEEQAYEFILFACLIFVAAIAFIILAYSYIPVDENEFTDELGEDKNLHKDGFQNLHYGNKVVPVEVEVQETPHMTQL